MAAHGEYTNTDSVIGFYKHGKLERIIENVNPETVFLHEDYHREEKHFLDFDYTENGIILKASLEIYPMTSFRIFPSWMSEKLKDILQNR